MRTYKIKNIVVCEHETVILAHVLHEKNSCEVERNTIVHYLNALKNIKPPY